MVEAKFLYPTSRQFPFDEAAETIVRELAKRNWNIPGMKVTITKHGSGEDKYEYVESVEGEDFRLEFGINRCSGKHVDISEICIPQKELHVYNDESGPIYWHYIGNNWEVDKKEWFIRDRKELAKMRGLPRFYLKYSGDHSNCGVHGRPTMLTPEDDINREYLPERDEPTEFVLSEVFDEMKKWLEDVVLPRIRAVSTAQVPRPAIPPDELISYYGLWKIVYSAVDWDTHLKIEKGQRNPKDLEPKDRFALGRPRFEKCIHENGEARKEIKYWTHLCCDPDLDKRVRDFSVLHRAVHNCNGLALSARSDNFLVAIELKYANDVFVVDFSEPEIDGTAIPINDYNGEYEDPIIWVCRELEFDEIANMKMLPHYMK